MASFNFKFVAFSGAKDEEFLTYILDIDDVRILLDPGWDFKMSKNHIDEISKYMDKVDLILLSSSDIRHVGCLPYLFSKFNLRCPIYATSPVKHAAKLSLYDYYQALYYEHEDVPFSLDDIDSAISHVVPLKFMQSKTLKGTCSGISLLPLNSGFTLGSCIWKINKDEEGDIIYAIDINHKKQLHINEAMIHGIMKPYIYICDAFTYKDAFEKRKTRVNEFTNELTRTLTETNGTVLIFSDTAGQILELLFQIGNILKSIQYSMVEVVLVSHVAHHVTKLLVSHIEWLNPSLVRNYESGMSNILNLINLYSCQTIEELDILVSTKVVITSSSDMDYYLSRVLFKKYSQNPDNSIIFTSKFAKDSVASLVIEGSRSVELKTRERKQLDGEALASYINLHELDDETMKERVAEEEDLKVTEMLSGGSSVREGFSRKTFPSSKSSDKCKQGDAYGEFVDYKDLVKLGSGNKAVSYQASAMNTIEKIQMVDLASHPTKVVETCETVKIQARIYYMLLENRIDTSSQIRVIKSVQPKHLIVVHADAESTEEFCGLLREENEGEEGWNIYAPDKNKVITICEDEHSYYVRLKDYQLETLNFSKFSTINISRIEGILNKEEYSSNRPLLEIVPRSKRKRQKSVFVNNFKLNEFKDLVSKLSIDSVFSHGVLICSNGAVRIQKHNDENVNVDAVLCKDYYKIISALYTRFAII